jgi:carboxypeptidase PM20D1
MKTLAKIGLIGLSGLLITAGIIGLRYATFAPDAIGTGAGIAVKPAPAFDIDAAAKNLATAIRFQTVSHQEKSENDLSQWDGLQSWLQSTYPSAHGRMQREFVADKTLVYTWPGSDSKAQPIILMAHQDVVPVTPGTEKDWKHAPFSGAIIDGAIWGRGSVDDKGSLIALFEGLETLAKQGFVPKRTLIIVSGHDEEAGGSGAIAAAALLAKRSVKALFTIDEGGIIATNAPIINAPGALIGVAEKGYATLKVTANAQGGHSSMPPKDTGVVNLAKAVIAINDNPFPMEMRTPAVEMLNTFGHHKGGVTGALVANQWLFGGVLKNEVAKTPSGAASLHTTIAPTMLTGSPKENVLPQSATALINYRIAPWNSSKDIMDRAKSATKGMPVTLDWVKPPREPSKVSSTQSQGWNLIVATMKASTPNAVAAPYLVLAGTDSRSMEGVSEDVYRFLPFQLSLKDTAMIHGTNEHISIDNLKRTINFYAQLIVTSAG